MWTFSIIVAGAAAAAPSFPDQQACLVARAELHQKWPFATLTDCTAPPAPVVVKHKAKNHG